VRQKKVCFLILLTKVAQIEFIYILFLNYTFTFLFFISYFFHLCFKHINILNFIKFILKFLFVVLKYCIYFKLETVQQF
jgi:hypothetical protein